MILLLFAWFNWKVIKSDNFTVIHKPGYRWEAEEAIYNLEFYKEEVWHLTTNRYRNLPVVIEDIGTAANGYADPLFRNIHLFTYPPNPGFEIDATRDWYRSVGIHEYTHICHLTRTSDLARPLNLLFGFPFLPNLYSPPWVIEGITVLSESRFPFEGRLNDGLFDSYLGATKDTPPSILTATYLPLQFPYYMGAYLYGGEFFRFLDTAYGEERIGKFFEEYGGCFWAPFGLLFPALSLDLAARLSFGCDFPALFTRWQQKIRDDFKEYEVIGLRLTDDGWFKSYLTAYRERLYYFHSYYQKVEARKIIPIYEVVEYDPRERKKRVLVRTLSPIIAPFRFDGDRLYFLVQDLTRGGNNVYLRGCRITGSLYEFDLKEKKIRRVGTADIRAFAILDGKILVAQDRRHHFGSDVYLDDELLLETDLLIGELMVEGGRIFLIGRKNHETWNIYELDPQLKTITPIRRSSWVLANLNPSPYGPLYTANFDRRYRLYLLDLNTNLDYRLTENGYANFGIIHNDSLYFLGLNRDGFDLYLLPLNRVRFNFPAEPLIPPEPDPRSFPLTIQQGSYFDILATMTPSLRLPIFVPLDTTLKSWLLGGVVAGADATGENTYLAFIGYNQLQESLALYLITNSRFCSPVEVDLFYRHNHDLSLSFDYPLLITTRPGLNRIYPFLRLRWFDRLRRREAFPGLRIGIGLIDWDLTTSGGVRIEPEIDRLAPELSGNLSHLLWGGEVKLDFYWYYDPDSIPIKIRGDETQAKTGERLMFGYTHPILRIRKGSWNPNIFIEDLSSELFFDLARVGVETIYSAGIILRIEVGLGLGLIRLRPGVGIVVTKEGRV
ncbi:hypothetical protein DRP53_08880, partial [candidate division WOR-3 bacterium]